MSGGSFDYKCFAISSFAEELKHKIDINDEDNGYGSPQGTMECLIEAQKIIELAGKLAREVEWYYSCDHGDDSYQRLHNKRIEESGLTIQTRIFCPGDDVCRLCEGDGVVYDPDVDTDVLCECQK